MKQGLIGKVPISVLVLLLIGSGTAYRIHRNHIGQDNMMVQIDSHTSIDSRGIFDKAIAKIEKEENEKSDAVNLLKELEERQILDNKRQSLHQKHYLAAQKEAEQMLRSMQNEAEMTAQEKLETIVSDQIKQEEDEKASKAQEEEGTTGFLSGINKMVRDDQVETKQVKDRELAIKEKVQTVVAPKMAEEALTTALISKEKTDPTGFSVEALTQMKRKLAGKLSKSQPNNVSAAQTELGSGSTLEQFDQLKIIQGHSISEKQKEDMQDDEKKPEPLDPEQIKIMAAHSKQSSPSREFQNEINKEIEQDDALNFNQSNQSEEDKLRSFQKGPPAVMEDDLDNPISAMTALKHPEIMEKAREHQYDDEMFGYDNGRHVY